jgi:hypothetical protein
MGDLYGFDIETLLGGAYIHYINPGEGFSLGSIFIEFPGESHGVSTIGVDAFWEGDGQVFIVKELFCR